jgi:hypothetical protein
MKKVLMNIGVCKVVSIYIVNFTINKDMFHNHNLSKFQSFHGYAVRHILPKFLKIQTNL